MIIQDKDTLIAAVANSELYSDIQSKILQELIKVSINQLATASAKYLHKTLGVSIAAIYTALKVLQNNGVIIKVLNENNTYKLNEEKLEYMVQLYLNKK
jgi:Fe2+ or Zn2+ uptake regulation protein